MITNIKKPLGVFLLILGLVLTIFVKYYYNNNKTMDSSNTPIVSEAIKKVCNYQMNPTNPNPQPMARGEEIGAWKDKNGNIKYFQIPLTPGNDEFVFLFDSTGNFLLRSGGFVNENPKEYHDLIDTLTFGKAGECP